MFLWIYARFGQMMLYVPYHCLYNVYILPILPMSRLSSQVSFNLIFFILNVGEEKKSIRVLGFSRFQSNNTSFFE